MLNINANKKELLKKGISVFSIRLVAYGFGFLFTWILANKYGSKYQGIFAIAFLFLSIGAMVSKLGVETSLVKWIAKTTHIAEKKNIYLKSLQLISISSSIIALMVYLLAPLIAIMYNKPDIKSSIQIAALGIPLLSILDVSSSYFRGEKKIKTFGFYYHLGKYFFPFFLLLFFYLFGVIGLETPIITYVLGLLLISFTIIIHLNRVFKGSLKKKDVDFTYKYIILESVPMMISSAIVMIMGWSDVFILGFFETEERIGVYSVAIKLATLVSFIYNAIGTIAAPQIASYYHNNNNIKLLETVSFSARVLAFCGIPIFLVIFLFAEPILNIFGDEYIVGVTVLRILLIAQLTNVLTGVVGPIFQMTGRQKALQNIILIALCFNIICSLLLVNDYGILGVAIGSAIGMALWNLIGYK